MKTFLIPATLLAPFIVSAQSDPPPDTLDTPIDTWLIVLIVAVVIYAAFKFLKIKGAKTTSLKNNRA